MDYLSLKAAVSEAGKRFSGRKVRDSGQFSSQDIVFRFEREAALVLSINPPRPGIFILDGKTPQLDAKTAFTELLEARIKGTSLKSIRLFKQGERIVVLDLAAGWPDKPGDQYRLILEVMGQHSNLMMLQGDTILQPLKIVPDRKSRIRPIIPGERWHPPPSQPGIALEKITSEELPTPSSLRDASELIQAVQGLSPHTADQALKRSMGGSPDVLFKVLTSMILSADGENGYLHRVGPRLYLTPFQPVIAQNDETVEHLSPFSAASAVWREEGHPAHAGRHDEREQLASGLESMREGFLSALEKLDAELERCRTHERVRLMAETLLIHTSEVKQGLDSTVLPNPYNPKERLTIPLDPSISVVENTDRKFADAHRLKRGIDKTSQRRREVIKQLDAVDRALSELKENGVTASAKTLLKKQPGGNSSRGRGSYRAYTGPGKRYSVDGFTVLVGRSARDNEKITFYAAGPHDLWLHARDYPGSHVVILSEKRKVPDKVLYRAAELAVQRSGARNEKAPEVMVTERKWVRKIKGDKTGAVTVERFRTIRPGSRESESRSQKKK